MSRPLSIVAVQTAPVAWDPAATLRTFEAQVRALHASSPTARLFVYPELHLSALGRLGVPVTGGYSMRRVAETIPGPLTERLCGLAKELGIWLVPGSIYERGEGDTVYNTAIAISPDGSIRARYRKVFPWRPREKTTPGSEFVVFDIDGIGRAGLMICYDGWFPEVARHLAWMGAEVIIQPTLTDTSDRTQELVLAQANAIVNQVFLVNVNAGGALGAGLSRVVDPEGHVLSEAGEGEAAMTLVIDLDAVPLVREHGTAGLNRLWTHLAEDTDGLTLPLYGGDFSALTARAVPAKRARRGAR
jgi:formamidase